jgi:hypothetical protein
MTEGQTPRPSADGRAMLQIVREEVITDLLAQATRYAEAGKLFHAADARAIAYKLTQELHSRNEKA